MELELDDGVMVLEVEDRVACPAPGCSAPAEVLDRPVLDSTCGPVEHLKVRCHNGHGFMLASQRW